MGRRYYPIIINAEGQGHLRRAYVELYGTGKVFNVEVAAT